MEFWERAVVVAGVIGLSALAAKLVDRRIARQHRSPELLTRYRVLRRGIMATIVTVGILSALLVIPQVRAIAGGLLASSAVLGLVIGFASQRTIGNFVSGVMIALTQPLRLGDRIEFGGREGVVEEIGLVYTIVRADDNSRVVIPNEKLASDTIVNSTIVSREKYAQITVQVPPNSDLGALLDVLRAEAGDRDADAFVAGLDGSPTLVLRVRAEDAARAERLEQELRAGVHARLRERGAYE